MSKIKVLIVDDSAFMRHALQCLLAEDPNIEVVATAEDPFDAREKIKIHNPDVMTLDIEMPKMDGLTFLQKVMHLRPMPVVMISSLTEKGANATIKALELGAFDYIAKPTSEIEKNMSSIQTEICEKVKAAYQARGRIGQPKKPKIFEKSPDLSTDIDSHRHIIIIGSSTGGVEALTEVIEGLPANAPAVIITQHMPERFTASFAKRLDKLSPLTVIEVTKEEAIKPGHVYIAAGYAHMTISSDGRHVNLDSNQELVSGHKPSVDVLFSSAAKYLQKKAIGIILTGMGKDGAEGLLKMRKSGAKTFAQNEESCVVYGMPKAAKNIGAVEKELDINEVATTIMQCCKRNK